MELVRVSPSRSKQPQPPLPSRFSNPHTYEPERCKDGGGPAEHPVAQKKKTEKTVKICVVDDEDALRRGIRRCLSRLYAVQDFASASEALDAITNPDCPYIPDVLVTDFDMPGMTGGTLASELKLRFPNLKIIMVTGQKSDRMFRTVSLINAPVVDAFLRKPFDMDDLLVLIKKVLGPVD